MRGLPVNKVPEQRTPDWKNPAAGSTCYRAHAVLVHGLVYWRCRVHGSRVCSSRADPELQYTKLPLNPRP